MLIQQHTAATTTWLGDRVLRVSAQKQKYYKTNSLQLKIAVASLAKYNFGETPQNSAD